MQPVQFAANMHPVEITYTKLARSDGSAKFSFGQTSALASVSGPIEVRPLSELPSSATFEVHVRPLDGVPGTPARTLATSLRMALSPVLLLSRHPRTLVQLVVQALSPTNSPGLLAASLNAATCAFLSAGSVPMSGIVVAVSVGRVTNGQLVLDPAEDRDLTASGCFAFMFSGGNGGDARLVWGNYAATPTADSLASEEIEQATNLARDGATIIRDVIKASLPSIERGRATIYNSLDTLHHVEEQHPTIDDPMEDDSDNSDST